MNSLGPRPNRAGPRSDPARRTVFGGGVLVLAMLFFAVLNAFWSPGPPPADVPAETNSAMAPVDGPDGAEPVPASEPGAAAGEPGTFSSDARVAGSADASGDDPAPDASGPAPEPEDRGADSGDSLPSDSGPAGAGSAAAGPRGSSVPRNSGSASAGSGSAGSGGAGSGGASSGRTGQSGSQPSSTQPGASDSNASSGRRSTGSGAQPDRTGSAPSVRRSPEPRHPDSRASDSRASDSRASESRPPESRAAEPSTRPDEHGRANSFPDSPDTGGPGSGQRSYPPDGSVGGSQAESSGGVIGAVRPSARAAKVLPPNFNPPVRQRRPPAADGPPSAEAGRESHGDDLPGPRGDDLPGPRGDTGPEPSGDTGRKPGGPETGNVGRKPGGAESGDVGRKPGGAESGDVGREPGTDAGVIPKPRRLPPGVNLDDVPARPGVGERNTADHQSRTDKDPSDNGRVVTGDGREMTPEEVTEMVREILDRLGIRVEVDGHDDGPIKVSGRGWTIIRDRQDN